jgi:hypothetical protein
MQAGVEPLNALVKRRPERRPPAVPGLSRRKCGSVGHGARHLRPFVANGSRPYARPVPRHGAHSPCEDPYVLASLRYLPANLDRRGRRCDGALAPQPGRRFPAWSQRWRRGKQLKASHEARTGAPGQRAGPGRSTSDEPLDAADVHHAQLFMVLALAHAVWSAVDHGVPGPDHSRTTFHEGASREDPGAGRCRAARIRRPSRAALATSGSVSSAR